MSGWACRSRPAEPTSAAVKATLPYGEVTIEVVPGGMLVPNGLDDGGKICVVNAAVEVAVATVISARRRRATAGRLISSVAQCHGQEHGRSGSGTRRRTT